MASYTPCEGSGQNAVNIQQYPSRPDGLGMTRAKTFGECAACGRTVMNHGITGRIKVNRHKAQASEAPAPVSPYVADPDNPTGAELDAAIQRSLQLGTLIDAGDWMARNAEYAGS